MRLQLALQYHAVCYNQDVAQAWHAPVMPSWGVDPLWSMPAAPRPRSGTWCAGSAGKKTRQEQAPQPRARTGTWCAEESKCAASGTSTACLSPGAVDVNGDAVKTTVVLRGIPRNLARDDVQSLLDQEGFAHSYDFLYLPHNFSTQTSFGYAFVNFINEDVAQRFFAEFSGFGDRRIDDASTAETSWSVGQQGFAAQVERFRNSPVMHSSVPETMQPVIFRDGVRLPFPAPTAAIKAPRLRKNSVNITSENPSLGSGQDAGALPQQEHAA